MIGNLLERLFISVGADLTDFTSEMSNAKAETKAAASAISQNLETIGAAATIAYQKMGEAAKIAIAEVGPILSDGIIEGVSAGAAKAVEVMAEEGVWAGITAGLDEALVTASQDIGDSITSLLLPKLLEAAAAAALSSTAFTALKANMLTLIPILSGVGKAFLSLMIGPLGLIVLAVGAVVAAWVYWDEIVAVVKRVGAAVSDWYTSNLKPTVDLVIKIVKDLVAIFTDYFATQLDAVIKLVKALFAGDFKGAFEIAKSIVANALGVIITLLGNLPQRAVSAFAGIYKGAKDWLQGRLSSIFDWLGNKLMKVGDFFYNLWDRVVGNSYIPDLVDGIAHHIARVDGVLVRPMQQAAKSAGDAMQELQTRVNGLLNELFPDQAKARELEQKWQDINDGLAAGLFDERTATAAKLRISGLMNELRDEVNKQSMDSITLRLVEADDLIPADAMQKALDGLDLFSDQFTESLQEPLLDSVDRIANGVADMAFDVDASLRGLVSSIKSGDIAGIIVGVAESVFSIASAISGISSGFRSSSSSGSSPLPGRATGGIVNPGGAFMVGENGPEILRMGRDGGRVYNATDTKKMMAGGRGSSGRIEIGLAVEASEYFDGRVMKVTQPGLVSAAEQGAIGGHSITVREQRQSSKRRIPG